LVSLDELRELLHQEGLARKDLVLLVLALEGNGTKTVAQIKQIGKECGVPRISKWNVSQLLAGVGRLARRVPQGWELTEQGRTYLRDKGWVMSPKLVVRDVLSDLRKHASGISEPQIVQFLDEAITSLEVGAYRAAVVFTWVGAVAVLQDYTHRNALAQFNVEAPRHEPKWKDAKTVDDLGKMKEATFLETIAAISVIGRNVKQALEECLKRRNACGHPSSFRVSQRQAAAHIEVLILNVFSKF
jgi:hypothetical protein